MYKPHTSIEIFSRFFKGFVALEIIIDLPFGFFPINNIISLISIILAGHYVCSEDLLEARVVLLCKDSGNPTLLANYRPIALWNSFNQLINIIITSRIQGLTERYDVLESSLHGL